MKKENMLVEQQQSITTENQPDLTYCAQAAINLILEHGGQLPAQETALTASLKRSLGSEMLETIVEDHQQTKATQPNKI